MRKGRSVGRLAAELILRAGRQRKRVRQQRAGRATAAELELYARQRRRDLPPGHPYV